MEQVKFFAVIESCALCSGNVSIIRHNTETGYSAMYDAKLKEFGDLPDGFVFDAEKETYCKAERAKSLFSDILGLSYVVVKVAANDWQSLIYKTPNGWERDEFGDWVNKHYQVGANIRLNCQTGKWDLLTHKRTESFASRYEAFVAWETAVTADYPFYKLRDEK